MVKQVIKQPSNQRFEESLEPVRIGSNCFIFKKGGQDAHLKLSNFPISAPGHRFIEAELITKVLKEQAFVVASRFRDGIDPRPVETVLRKDRFCGVENCFRAPSALWTRPRRRSGSSMYTYRSFSYLTDCLNNYLVRL